jgi:hypothetical protein
MNTRNIKSYSELITLESYEERFEYLKLSGVVGRETFGHTRMLNQLLYNSPEWKRFRRDIILRDNGCDLALDGFDIQKYVYVHHINPITPEDILGNSFEIFNPDNVVCTSQVSHQAIHYGNYSIIQEQPSIRSRNDTCPWR